MKGRVGRPPVFRDRHISADDHTVNRLKEMFPEAGSASESLEMLIDGFDEGLFGPSVPFDINKRIQLKGFRARKRKDDNHE